MAEYKRLVFDLSPEVMEEVDKLKDSLKIKNRTELVRHALGLLSCVVKHKQEGYVLQFRKGKKIIKVALPIL